MRTSYICTAFINIYKRLKNAGYSALSSLIPEIETQQLSYQKITQKRQSERGNVFFTLFGAVAVVGVLGAGIMSTMRGPLSTMVEVNLRERAKVEMSIASKLIMLESADQANSGDCDSDGFIEPIGYSTNIVGLTGGGELPVGNKQDPWGNNYGYCGWDAGTATSDAACTGDYTNLLDGDAPTGNADYSVIAIISAGPDGVFQSTCADHATLVTPSGDDLVEEYSYEYATESTGGLWDIKAGFPDVAEIDKDLEVTGGATFSDNVALGASSQLQLGASSLLLPDQVSAPTCNPANDQILRRNTSLGFTFLEICDDTASTGTNNWVNIASAGSIWSTGTGDDIYYNPTTPQVGIGTTSPDDTLDVVGTFDLSSTANIGGLLTAENGLTVSSGTTTLGTTNISGATTISNTLGVTNDVTITGSNNTGTGDSLTVNNSDSSVVFVVQHDGRVGIGDVDPSQELEVSGDILVSGSYMIDGYNVVASPNTTLDTNIFLGNSAGNMAITNTLDGNTIVGGNSGIALDGANNTVLGADSGTTNLTTGTNNILIGQGLDVSVAGASNELNIGGAITGSLTSNNIRIAGDLTVSGDDLTMNTNTDGAILVADGTNFNPVVASGDAAIANDGTITIQNDAVQDDDIDASSFSAGSGSTCLKTDGSTIFTQTCSGGGGGDGVGGDGLPEVLANDASANSTAITDVADPTNAQDAATKNYVDTQLGALSSDRIQDATGNTSIDVDTTNDGLTDSIVFTTNSTDRITINSTGNTTISSNGRNILTVQGNTNNAGSYVSRVIDTNSGGDNDRYSFQVLHSTSTRSFSISPGGEAYIQNGLAIGTTTPNANAVLDLVSNDKGFLPPRNSDPNANITGTAGLIAYDSTDNELQFYDGTAWIALTDAGSAVSEISDLTDVDTTGAASNDILQFDGATWVDRSLQDAIDNASTGTCGETWTARSAAEANTWLSVTYGGGQFVAVAGNGTNRVMTSPDGITWTARSAAEANFWISVTHNGGQFVAVAQSGTNRVMTSPDGITWTARAAAEANSWRAITYGGGQFVAVAPDGTNRVMTSPDGITWTARTASEANNWSSVTYGGGQFVAVSNDGTNRVMTSPDGITWTARTAAEANTWRHVTYGGGQFVAVSGSGTNRVMTSPDGITWTARTAAENNDWRSVTYANGQFVAVSDDGTNRVMTSPDGITWTARAAAQANLWFSVAYGNNQLVAVSQNGTNRVMTAPCTQGGLSIADASRLVDDDGDTQIQVEEGSDDDTIRFDTDGNERMVIAPNGNVGIGTSTPAAAFEVAGTDSILFPRGTTAQQPSSSVNGMMRYNTENDKFEAYQGGIWQDILTSASGNIVDDSLDFDKFVDAMNLDASTSITADGTETLSIVNTGTGNSFLVEDQASDTSPFVITDTGRVGIGTPNPGAQVVVSNSGVPTIELSDTSAGTVIGLALSNNSFSLFETSFGANRFLTYNLTNDNIGIGGTTNPEASALLELSASDKGFLPPRMDDPENDITGEVAGLIAYDSTSNELQYFDGTSWISLADANAPNDRIQDADADTYIDVDNSDDDNIRFFIGDASGSTIGEAMTIDENGRLGIGTNTPTGKLHVNVNNSSVAALYLQDTVSLSPRIQFEDGSIIQETGTNSTNSSLLIRAGSASPGNTGNLRLLTDNTPRLVISSAGRVGIGTISPDTSAALDITSSTQGFLPPRMDDPENDITGEVAGLIAYDSTSNELQYFDGTTWLALADTSATSDTIIDADSDTQIQVEEGGPGTDDDTIRFDTAGTERMTIGPEGNIAIAISDGNTSDADDMLSLTSESTTRFAVDERGHLTATLFNGASEAGIIRMETPGGAAAISIDADGSGGAQPLEIVSRRIRINGSDSKSISLNENGVSIGTGKSTASAILEANSTTQGFLAPRMDDPENDITGEVAGLIAYDSTSNELQYFNGTSWITLADAAAVADRIQDADNDTYIDVDNTDDDNIRFFIGDASGSTIGEAVTIDENGRLGIGNNTPAALLHIAGTPGTAAEGITFGDGDTGLYETSDDNIGFNIGGSLRWRVNATSIWTQTGTGPLIRASGVSSIMFTRNADQDTGLGTINDSGNLANHLGLYTGNVVALMIDNAQRVGIGPTTSVEASAALEVSSTDKGFLPPRMTDPENDITGEVAGLIAYDSTSNELQYFNGTSWITLADAASSSDRIQDADNDTYIDVDTADDDNIRFFIGDASGSTIGEAMTIDENGNVGIGNNAPTGLLHVAGTPAGTGLAHGIAFGDGDTGIMEDQDDRLGFVFSGGGPRWRMDTGSFFSATSSGVSIYSHNSGIKFVPSSSDTDIGLGLTTDGSSGFLADHITLYTAGAEALTIDDVQSVGIGTLAPDASSIVDITSSNKGFLPPRMTDPENDITGEVAGLIAYDSTSNELQYFDGTSWVALGGATAIAIDDLTDGFNDATNNNFALGHEFPSITGTGLRNTSIGRSAGDSITTADDNVVLGYLAGDALSTGSENTIIGSSAGEALTSGSRAVIIGYNAYSNRTNGIGVIALGYNAAELGTGDNSIAIGSQAMRYVSNSAGSVAIGTNAMRSLGGSSGNVAIGQNAGLGGGSSAANNNVMIGFESGQDLTNGDNNVLLGYQTGYNITAGSDNIIIGYAVDSSSATASNQLNIGGTLFGDLSTDRIGIGVADATAIDASALLDLTSSSLGFLPPRMSDPENDITGEVAGLIAYDSTSNELQYYDGTSWIALGAGGAASIADDALDFDKFVDSMNLDAPTSITADGTETLSIVNTGTGNSFLVEDEASDTTPFVIAPGGNVGIGTTTPGTLLDVQGTMSVGRINDAADSTTYIDPSASRINFVVSNRTYLSLNGGTADYVQIGQSGDDSNPREIRMGNGNVLTLVQSTDSVGIGTGNAIDASAVFQIDSSDKGFLPPRMADPENDITGEVAGLIAYDSTSNELQYFDGTSWIALGAGGAASIADDALDWDKFTDTMTLDATTTVDMTAGNLTFDTDVLHIDSATDTVQFGTTADFSGTLNDSEVVIAGGTNNPALTIQQTGGSNRFTDIDFVRSTTPQYRIRYRTQDSSNASALKITDSSDRGIMNSNNSLQMNLPMSITNSAFPSDRKKIADDSALLDLQSSSLGFLPPRMDDPENDITGEVAGLIAYDSTSNELQYFNGTSWITLTAGGDDLSDNVISDLSDVDTSGVADGELLLYDGITDNAWESVALSGDATVAANGTLTITDDIIDWSEITDTMILDATTTIDMTAGDLNFDAATLFIDSSANAIGIGTATPDTSALLDLTSSSLGFLPPRMSDPENDITGEVAGLIAYDSTSNELQYFNGTSWITLADGGAVADRIADADNDTYIDVDNSDDDNIRFFIGDASGSTIGEAMTIDENGRLGIGTNAPATKFEVSQNLDGGTIATIQNTATDYTTATTLLELNAADTGDDELTYLSLNNSTNEVMKIYEGDTADRLRIDFPSKDDVAFLMPQYTQFFHSTDFTGSGSAFRFSGLSSNRELVSSSAEQTLMYIDGDFAHSGTAAANTLWVNSEIATLGDGTAGSGNNILKLTTQPAGGSFVDRMVVNMDGQLGLGTAAPDASSIMDLSSSSLGFLPPRMTDPENDITGEVAGLIAYDSTSNELQYYDGTSWVALGGATAIAIDDLTDATTDYATDFNMFLGDGAGANPTTGAQYNIAIGQNALSAASKTTAADQNLAIGHSSLAANRTGVSNIALGRDSLAASTTGNNNIAIGVNAMSVNTQGSSNVAVGLLALVNNTTGEGNAIIGFEAAGRAGLTDGDMDNNTVMGYRSGYNLTGGASGAGANNNILYGYQAGYDISTGDDNIVIGYDNDTSSATASQELNLGNILFGNLGDDPGTGGTTEVPNIGIGVTDAKAIDTSAILDLTSTDRGFLAPRMTTTQRDAITTPAASLMIFNTTENEYQFNAGTSGAPDWTAIGGATCSDTTPDAFNFTDNASATASTLTESDIVQINGLGCAVTATATGSGSPQIKTCSDASCTTIIQDWTSSAVQIADGEYIQLRVTSSATGGATFSTTLFVGSGADDWNVTTTGGDCSIASPVIGTVCADGTVFAGISSDGSVKMYTTRCDAFRTWNGSICTGTRTSLSWATGTTTNNGFTSANTGLDNTYGLDALGSTGDGPFSAANHCATLNQDGHTDWYLPAQNENFVLYTNRAVIGDFSTDNYWTSTEVNASSARRRNFSTGNIVSNPKTSSGLIRCVRREGASPPAASPGGTDGQVQYNDSGALAGSADFFWDDTNTRLGIGTSTPDASSILDLTSTDSGFLPPRMTDPENDITGEVAGLIAYDSTSNELQYFNGTSWIALGAGGSVADDSLDWDKFTDTMVLDATTTIDMTAGNLDFNSGTFLIDSANDRVEFRRWQNPNSSTGGASFISTNRFDITLLNESIFNANTTSDEINIGTGGTFDITLGSATSGMFVDNTNSRVGVGTATPDIKFHAESDSAAADTVTSVVRLTSTNDGTGTIAAGIGVGMEFEIETATDNNEIGATIEAVTTDVTATSEDVDLVFSTMAAGATANEAMRITGTGNVGIGTGASIDANAALEIVSTDKGFLPPRNTDPATNITGTEGLLAYDTTDDELQVYDGSSWVAVGGGGGTPAGANTQLQFNDSGAFGASANLTWDGSTFAVTGDIDYSGVITDTSDRRLKTNIAPLNTDDILNRLTQIDTYSFTMKDDPNARTEFGVMAQELETLFPELVHTATDEMGTKSVNYIGLIAPIIETTKTLKAENDALKAELDTIKSQHDETLSSLASLQEDVQDLKIHTGLGTQKANTMMMLLMLLMMGGFGAYIVSTRRKNT